MTEEQSRRIADNLKRIRQEIEEAALSAGRGPEEIRLMAVTKTVPADVVNLALEHGVRLLGENRAQELNEKYPLYHREGVEIHFIGRLQTNKVRQVVDKVSMIHSVDSAKLAAEIDRQAKRTGRIMDVLIEVNVGGEDSKTGISPEQLDELCGRVAEHDSLRLRGLMTIPPICDTIIQCERFFSAMERLYVDIKAKNRDNRSIDILSMGMSGDFPAAIRHGSTLVRLGTALFGER